MLIALFTAIVSFYLLGLTVQIILFGKKNENLLNLGEIFGFGFGLAGFLMVVTSVIHLKFSSSLFSFIIVIFFVAAIVLKRPKFGRLLLPRINRCNFILLLLFLIFIITLWIKTFSFPIWGYDAYAIWLGRAGAFFVDKSINPFNIKAFWPPEYPPLWSLTIAWIYVFLGEIDELAVRFLPFLFYLLIIFTFYKNLKGDKFLKYIFTIFLMTLPQLLDNVIDPQLAGNADLFLSFYFLLAIIAINKKEFSKAGLFLALASWIKSDATPSVLIFIILLILLKIKKRLKPAVFASLPVMILFGAKYILGITSRYFKGALENLSFPYFWYDFMAFREEFRKISNWNLVWWLFFFVLLTKIKEIFRKKEVLFSWLIVVGQILSYYLIFLITPDNQAGHIASAIYRLLLHVAPAALLLTFNTF